MKKRLTLLFACLAVLILGCSTFAYAAGYSGAAIIQGLRGIVGADTLELPNNTVKSRPDSSLGRQSHLSGL